MTLVSLPARFGRGIAMTARRWTPAHGEAARRPSTTRTEVSRSAQSFLEPGVVAHGGEVGVGARLLPEGSEELDGSPKGLEPLVARVAGKRRQAGVVEMQPGMIGDLLEPFANRG